MKVNYKLCSLVASVAFVLSFFIALISGAGFGISLLRGIILALCFVALALGINFVYDKFLNENQQDSGTAAQVQESASPIGNKVDITIDDEELPDEDDTPKFILTGQNQMLNKEDLSKDSLQFEKELQDDSNKKNQSNSSSAKSSSAADTRAESSSNLKNENSKNSFKPITLGQSADLDSDELPAIENTLGDGSFLKPDVGTDGDVLDVLPDMGEGTKASEQVVTDSEFAVGGKTTSRLNEALFPDGSKAENKDAVLMAEALRTVLKNGE